jgi:hypothetical protein
MTQVLVETPPRTLRFADFPEQPESAGPIRILTAQGVAPSPDAFSRTPAFGASEQRARVLLAANEELVVVDDPDGYQVMLCGGLNCSLPGPYGEPLKGTVVSSRFDQYDYTVFLGLLRYVGGRLGVSVVFEPYAFVKSIGLTDNPRNVRTLFESIARMAETRVAVRQPVAGHPGEFEYLVGRLVSSVAYSTMTGKYSVMLDARMAGLFRPAHFSSLVWQHRLAIKSTLARWLHAELTSHESGRFRWVHKLQEAYGSSSPARVFKGRLKKAAEEVAEVTGWTITFEKSPRSHLEKLVVIKNGLPPAEAGASNPLLGNLAAFEDNQLSRPRFAFAGPPPADSH